MSGKHTLGPWHWSNRFETYDNRPTWSLLSAGGCGILSCDGEGNSPQGLGDEANARLIAAAPELLEALESLLDAATAGLKHPWDVDESKAISMASAIIAKATGKVAA